jgi:hypothetical protein
MRRTAVGAGACRRRRWRGGRWGRRWPLGWVGFGLVCRSETPAGGGTGDMWKETGRVGAESGGATNLL